VYSTPDGAEGPTVSVTCTRTSAGQDLVGSIGHGPGSIQPFHHLRMASISRSVERFPSVLSCTAHAEIKRELLCCLCQASSKSELGGVGAKECVRTGPASRREIRA
jgi:hypothetical protein